MSKTKLTQLLDEYDSLPLECDGFTRVVTYLLSQAGIEHKVFAGRCRVGTKVVAPHFWIRSGRWTIDYRLRMWAGQNAPHGVFAVSWFPSVKYEGEEIDLPVPKVVFEILCQTGETNQ
jgi:hypothetical protein